MKRALIILVLAVVIVGGLMLTHTFYGYIFSDRIEGKVISVERLNQGPALIAPGQVSSAALFSFAVAIQTPSGEIFTASSEDRQWAAVKIGNCAEAYFYPYPFWNLEKRGTYHNARLIKQRLCETPAAQ